MHAKLGTPWTVTTLTDRAGMLCATLAKRFSEVVGEPPSTYLTRWHMMLVEWKAVATAEVTRGGLRPTPFAYSTAFKRIRGMN